MYQNTTGGNNTAIGANALFGNTTGTANIAVGLGAGSVRYEAMNATLLNEFLKEHKTVPEQGSDDRSPAKAN